MFAVTSTRFVLSYQKKREISTILARFDELQGIIRRVVAVKVLLVQCSMFQNLAFNIEYGW